MLRASFRGVTMARWRFGGQSEAHRYAQAASLVMPDPDSAETSQLRDELCPSLLCRVPMGGRFPSVLKNMFRTPRLSQWAGRSVTDGAPAPLPPVPSQTPHHRQGISSLGWLERSQEDSLKPQASSWRPSKNQLPAQAMLFENLWKCKRGQFFFKNATVL